MESGFVVVLVTAPGEEKAVELARALVEERLAACVSVVPRLRSIYRWEGAVQDDAEAMLVVKTRAELFERLRDRVLALHPYTCPEVIALPIREGHGPYLDWLAGATLTSS